MDAASFVIDNLTAQITSYEDVATKMRERRRAGPASLARNAISSGPPCGSSSDISSTRSAERS